MSDESIEEAVAKDTAKKEAESDAEKRPAAKKEGGPNVVVRFLLGLAGLSLIVGFFLPWFALGDESVSGLTLVTSNSEAVRHAVAGTQRWALFAVPGTGLLLSMMGFLRFRWSGEVAAILCFLLLGFGVVTLLYMLLQSTAIGLWMVIGGGLTGFTLGVVGWAWNSRQKQKATISTPSSEGEEAA
jgi:hypothetical protein